MGREIRMVPPNWEHPRYTKKDAHHTSDIGEYRPCYDQDYASAAEEWIANFNLWRNGMHEGQLGEYKSECKYYWEYENPPDEETCRPAFTEPATWYQAYQTVSEGSPVSPPFSTKEELIDYLATKGDFWTKKNGTKPPSRAACEVFVNGGYAPSMTISNGVIKEGIESAL